MAGIHPAGSAQAVLSLFDIEIAEILLIQKGTAALISFKRSLLPVDGIFQTIAKRPFYRSILLKRPFIDHDGPAGTAGVGTFRRNTRKTFVIMGVDIKHTFYAFLMILCPCVPDGYLPDSCQVLLLYSGTGNFSPVFPGVPFPRGSGGLSTQSPLLNLLQTSDGSPDRR